MTNPSGALQQAQQGLNLSNVELWWRYFALGGNRPPIEVEAIMFNALVGTSEDLDLLAAALNEEISRNGGDHPLPYHGDAAT